MRIKDLPPKLKSLAERRCKEQLNNMDSNYKDYIEGSLIAAFNFSKTKEGDEFWHTLNVSGKPYLPRLLKIMDWTKLSQIDVIGFNEITPYLDTLLNSKKT